MFVWNEDRLKSLRFRQVKKHFQYLSCFQNDFQIYPFRSGLYCAWWLEIKFFITQKNLNINFQWILNYLYNVWAPLHI